MASQISYKLADNSANLENSIVLTGDRPTGKLHLGHYVGSLKGRVLLQEKNSQYIMVANLQALTDNMDSYSQVSKYSIEIVKDYVACGIDPNLSTIFLQSAVPAVSELSVLFFNCVKYAKLIRNPTLKEEIKNKYKEDSVNVGFLCYPISQAADILAFAADVVPVGLDQAPMIEQCNDIVGFLNRLSPQLALKKVSPLFSNYPRLIGIDGKHKMSKSLNNFISLSETDELIKKKVFSMYTDANHIRVEDPGKVENNVVFSYLDVFFDDQNELANLKARYRKGGVSDVFVKDFLYQTLLKLISPIRELRFSITDDTAREILQKGSEKASKIAQKNLLHIKNALEIKI